jgi:hypothetical protein
MDMTQQSDEATPTVEQLRDAAGDPIPPKASGLLRFAAERIERMEAEIERLKAEQNDND